MFSKFALCSLVFAIISSATYCHSFDGTRLSASGSFTSPSESLIFNIGKHPLGSTVVADLSISNATGDDLDFEFKPSCGCTNLSIKGLIAKNGESFTINPTLKIPEVAQHLQIVIRCEEKSTARVFHVVIKGDAVAPFSSEPSVLKVDPKSLEGLSLKLVENFPGISLSSVEVLTKNLFSVERGEGLNLTIHPTTVKTHYDYDFLVFRLLDSKGKDFVLTVPIELVGVVQMLPSVVTLKSSDGGYKALVLLKGLKEPPDETMIDVCLGDGKTNWGVKGEVRKLLKRTEGVYMLNLLFSEDLGRFASEPNKASHIRVSISSGAWECVAPVTAFLK